MKRQFLKQIVPTLLVASAAAVPASLAQAQQPQGLYFPIGVMGYDYDESTRALEPSALPTLGLGYRIDSRWATEFMIAQGEADVDLPAGQEADVRQYRVDGLYFLDQTSGLTPYLVGGVGEMEADYDLGSTADDTVINAGAGLMYEVADNVALRGDVRAIHSLDYGNTEAAFNLLAQLSFGKTSRPAEPLDDDRDGVVNSKDRCPQTPPDKTVDKNGCDCNYAVHLQFAFDSAELTESDKNTLRQLGGVMEDLGYARANVVGHTDNVGEEAYNQDLSQRRAQAVVDYLVSQGAQRDMLNAVGRGESQPEADNNTEEGRAENRRVVFERSDCGK